MDALLVTANFLLVVTAVLLFYATMRYANAAKRMNKIVNRQAAIANLQAYLSVTTAKHLAATIGTTYKRIEHASKKFTDEFEENYDKVLNTIFESDPDC